MADDAKPFELVDDDDEPRKKPAKPAAESTTPDAGEREPAAESLPPLELEPDLEVPPELDPRPEPVADPGPYPSEAAAGAGDDAHAAGAVEELALEAAETDAPAPTFEDEGPSDGSTVRMSLADVVHAWDEDAPADAAHAAAGPVLREQGPGRRIAIMVLVIVVVLAVIIVLFASCAPAAHAAERDELLRETLAVSATPTASPARLVRPTDCCWRRWSLRITPYGFLADVDGDVWADGEKQRISIPFSDIIDRTTGGGMLHVLFGYDRWRVSVEGLYARLGDNFDVRNTNVDVRIKQFQLELAFGRRLLGPSFGRWVGARCCPPPAAPCPTLDVFAGMRYARSEITLTLDRRPGPVLPGAWRRATDTQDYWEPFLGAAWSQPLGGRWELAARGEVGGFDVGGGASTFAWRLEAMAARRLSRRLTLLLGWRLFEQDRVTGSGMSKAGTQLLQHGPLIGLAIAL